MEKNTLSQVSVFGEKVSSQKEFQAFGLQSQTEWIWLKSDLSLNTRFPAHE